MEDDAEDPFAAFVYTAEQDAATVEEEQPHVDMLEQYPPVQQNVQRPLWFMDIAPEDESHVLQVGTPGRETSSQPGILRD
eukprot:SAG31_NODE_3510_length_4179_cov_6.712500_3_plen_80_part_00